MKKSSQSESGFVLITVMWFLILIVGITLAIAANLRGDTQFARADLDNAQAKYIAQAAINLEIMNRLAGRRTEAFDRQDQSQKLTEISGVKVAVRVHDECGKIDLNTGWGRLIEGLMAQQTGDQRGLKMAQAILDWRDPDHRRRRYGAEDRDYQASGRSYGARDGVFDSVDEVQHVRDVDFETLQKLAPHLTVNCRDAGFDPLLASASVLAAVPGLEAPARRTFIATRADDPVAALSMLTDALGANSKYLVISPQSAFSITATVNPGSAAAYSWRAIVSLTDDPTRPYRIRAWHRTSPPAVD